MTPQHRSFWAQSGHLLQLDRMSGPDWRTAVAVHQHGSNVDLLGDAQGVFEFDTKISDSAVNLCVSQQELDRTQVPGFPVDLRRLGPAQRMGAVSAGFQSNRCHPIADQPTILTR